MDLPSGIANLDEDGLPRVLKVVTKDGSEYYGYYHEGCFVSNDAFINDVLTWRYVDELK